LIKNEVIHQHNELKIIEKDSDIEIIDHTLLIKRWDIFVESLIKEKDKKYRNKSPNQNGKENSQKAKGRWGLV